jgi:hypothetical protein
VDSLTEALIVVLPPQSPSRFVLVPTLLVDGTLEKYSEIVFGRFEGGHPLAAESAIVKQGAAIQ